MNSFASLADQEKYNEMKRLEGLIQLRKVSKKKQLKEVAARGGLSYKSVKKLDKKLRREMFNGK